MVSDNRVYKGAGSSPSLVSGIRIVSLVETFVCSLVEVQKLSLALAFSSPVIFIFLARVDSANLGRTICLFVSREYDPPCFSLPLSCGSLPLVTQSTSEGPYTRCASDR